MTISSHDQGATNRKDANRAQPPAAMREERLKAALKANIARRKAQARARASGQAADDMPGTESGKPHD